MTAAVCVIAAGTRHGAGDAEVHDLDDALAGQHHVARLDVTVNDPGTVAELEGRADVGGDFQRPLDREPAFLRKHVAQGAALDQLHDDVGTAAPPLGFLAGVVDRHDRGMVQ